MTCASCGEKKCNCKQDSCSAPAVLEIVNKPEIVTFHKVIIPASVGDETTKPPVPGLYRNTLLVYEASNEAYLYSSDCIPTKITDKAELKRLETLLGNEVAERKEADAYLEEKIDNIKGLKYEIVEALPETGEAGIIYLVPKTSEAPDFYDEYIWVNGAFEKIGSTEVDLDGYVKKPEVFHFNEESGEKDGVNISYDDTATATYGVAIGNGASATGNVLESGELQQAFAIGEGATAINMSYAIGHNATTEADGYAFGDTATAKQAGVAIGLKASADGSGTAVGYNAVVSQAGFEAIGSDSKSSTSGRAYAGAEAISGGTAFGKGAKAETNGFAMGSGANASASGIALFGSTANNGGISIGSGASALEGALEAIGRSSIATSGGRAYAGGNSSNGGIAISGTATNNAFAIGFGADATNSGLAISVTKKSGAASATASGGTYSMAIGYDTSSTNGGMEAIGYQSNAQSSGRAYAGGTATNSSIAVGGTSTGGGSVSLGGNSSSTGSASVAVGFNASANKAATVAIGTNSAANYDNSVAIGSGATTTGTYTASFGNGVWRRRLVNIGGAESENEAVAAWQVRNAKTHFVKITGTNFEVHFVVSFYGTYVFNSMASIRNFLRNNAPGYSIPATGKASNGYMVTGVNVFSGTGSESLFTSLFFGATYISNGALQVTTDGIQIEEGDFGQFTVTERVVNMTSLNY